MSCEFQAEALGGPAASSADPPPGWATSPAATRRALAVRGNKGQSTASRAPAQPCCRRGLPQAAPRRPATGEAPLTRRVKANNGPLKLKHEALGWEAGSDQRPQPTWVGTRSIHGGFAGSPRLLLQWRVNWESIRLQRGRRPLLERIFRKVSSSEIDGAARHLEEPQIFLEEKIT